MTSSPRHLPLKEILQQFRQGTLRSQDVTECAIDCYNEELGAYRDFRADAARQMALLADNAFTCGTDLGPLQGIPVSVKDLYGLAGTDTYAGSPQALPPCLSSRRSRCVNITTSVGSIYWQITHRGIRLWGFGR